MQNQKILASNTAAVLDMKAERLQPKKQYRDNARFDEHMQSQSSERTKRSDVQSQEKADRNTPQEPRKNKNDQNAANPNQAAIAKANEKAAFKREQSAENHADAQTTENIKQSIQENALSQEEQAKVATEEDKASLSAEPLMQADETKPAQDAVLAEPIAEAQALLTDALVVSDNLATETVPELAVESPSEEGEVETAAINLTITEGAAQIEENKEPVKSTPVSNQAQSEATPTPQLALKNTNLAAPETNPQKQIETSQITPVISIDGQKNKSLVADVLAQTQSLETSSVSQKALAGQIDLQGKGETVFSAEVRNALEAAFGAKATANKAADQNIPNLQLDQTGAVLVENTENAPLDQSAIEAELVEAELTAPKAKPAAEKSDAPVRAPLAAEALSNLAKAGVDSKAPSGSAPSEIGALQKTAATSQNLTSIAGKPEFAQMAQRSSQPIPVQTVGMHIARQASQGNTAFEIRLDPPELGRVDVKLEIADDGRMRAHLTVEKSETLDLLQRDQRALERTMQQNGMKGFEDVSFSLKDQGQGQGGERQQNAQQQNNGAHNGKDGLAQDANAQQMETIQFSRAQARRAMGGVDVTL